ncbi:phage protein Gp37/Gp68 [Leptospira weilii serovar Ranarum str. ICFT]|uniref:Phage protein Gp37/Gp68 n=1 Tax=Leptospira weilii serovar Ranarum str. ICFT TaxID=1218598 RepID=N1WD90_9LEPT|nr:phage Gp37/Gp68 family protein [Leptospira weilii]EMY76890.1 phage protein Gp37/Gp68 [Leptospira weilii serovar Ranarum str. ICFT]
MSNRSDIEWTEATWNPVTGCTKVSAGCANCYAETMTKRFEKSRGKFSEIKIHEDRLAIPVKRKKPTVYFVNSMSDLFHEKIPTEFILKVFKIMQENPRHTFQILTKRPERMLELDPQITWTPNIWMGVTVENRKAYDRIDLLRKTHAQTKFVSVEPLLESVADINLDGIDWCIVGGESGPKARPMKQEWVEEVLAICDKNSIPFFFKQWGGRNKKQNGRTLNGRSYDGYPRKKTVQRNVIRLELAIDFIF